MIKRRAFALSDLEMVRRAPPPDDPPLHIGDRCYLLSGSPVLLVVDEDTDSVTVAWSDGTRRGTRETTLLRCVVRRA